MSYLQVGKPYMESRVRYMLFIYVIMTCYFDVPFFLYISLWSRYLPYDLI